MSRLHQPSPNAAELHFRISNVLRLLQTSADSGVGLTVPLKRQLDAIRVLVKSDCDVAQSLATCTGDFGRAIAGMEAGAAVFRWVENGLAVLEVLPADGTSLLRSRLEVMRRFVGSVRDKNEVLCKHALARTDFNGWWRETIRQAELPAWRALAVIFREIELWPRVAQAIDAETYAAQAPRLTAARGRIAAQKPDLQAAAQLYEEALRLDPRCFTAMEGMAQLEGLQGNQLGAWDWYRKALDAGSVTPSTYNSYAWIASSNPQWDLFNERALWAARRAVEAVPTAEIWDTLAEALERHGDLRGALAAARASVRDCGDREAYRSRLERLLKLCGSAKGASNFDSRGSPRDTTSDSGTSVFGDESDDGEDFLLTPIKEVDDELDEASVALSLDDDAPPAAELSVLESDFCESEEPPSRSRMLGAAPAMSSEPSFSARHKSEAESAKSQPSGWLASLRRKLGMAKVPLGRARRRGDFSQYNGVPGDDVDCAVFAAPEARPGDSFLVQVFVHLPTQQDEATALAKEFDDQSVRRGIESLGTKIARRLKLAFVLAVPELRFTAEKSLIWKGRTASVQFGVNVPATFPPRSLTANVMVSQNSVPIGDITFKLTVVSRPAVDSRVVPIDSTSRRIERAFASYASPDRTEVCKRVQMARAAGIHCFQDLLDLDPGERWERRLYEYIDQSDALFLFWSTHSRDSEWVAREWRYALNQKGLEFIRPVILEGPPILPPPTELQALHFNDQMLYVMKET